MKETGREKYELREAMVKRYERMLNYRDEEASLEEMAAELTDCQKEDGSFRVIDDLRCPSDIRVDFIYFPTYYATAALMFADRHMEGGLPEKEKAALLKGLQFATGRQLAGHGFMATRQLIQTLRLYDRAEMYEWIHDHGEEVPEFKKMIDEHFHSFVIAVANKRTFSDWNEDFKKEFLQEIEDYENKCKPGVWYAAYGSNISSERFMKYISRCSDTAAPADSVNYTFGYNMYFAKKSSIWKGGVAFLDDSREGRAMGRRYLIKQSQFEEIMRMEGRNYSRKILLGIDEGKPIYTFTADHFDDHYTTPSEAYLETILTGLKEMYPDKSETALSLYLYSRYFLTEDDSGILQCIRRNAHAVSLKELCEQTRLAKTRVINSVRSLRRCGLVAKDKRSASLKADDMEAMFYCKKEKRELIDIMGMLQIFVENGIKTEISWHIMKN